MLTSDCMGGKCCGGLEGNYTMSRQMQRYNHDLGAVTVKECPVQQPGRCVCVFAREREGGLFLRGESLRFKYRGREGKKRN